jgi:predicted DNA-binding transcriptional regulator YafY
MLDTSARLLGLLSLLQARSDWTGTQLAERLGVTTRTIRNDVRRLRRLGYRVDGASGAAGGYRLAAGSAVPPLLLDDEEAIAVAISLRGAASGSVSGIEEASLRALIKVQQLLPAALRRRTGALEAFLAPVSHAGPTVDHRVLTALAAACRDRRRVLFSYERGDGEQSRRDIEPHKVVISAGNWYLLGWDVRREAWRTFRVDRIGLSSNHEGPRFVPRVLPDPDPARYVAKSIGEAMRGYAATVTAHAPAEELIARLPSQVRVDRIDADRSRVHAGARTPEQLSHYMGMLGVDFEIDEPASCPELVGELRRLAGRYARACEAAEARTPRPQHGGQAG